MFKRAKMRSSIMSRKLMYSALVFVLVSITTMTLAYAALSTTLTITGTAEFKDVSWGIIVEEVDVPPNFYDNAIIDGKTATLGTAKFLTKPTLTGTSINNFCVELTKPGDEAWMFYKITNTGGIPAALSSITMNEPTFTSSINNQGDILLMQDSFQFEAFMNGQYIEGGELGYGSIIVGDVLCPGAVYELYIGNIFDSEATSIPTSKVTISNLSVDFNFVAVDVNLCNGSTPVGSYNNNDQYG